MKRAFYFATLAGLAGCAAPEPPASVETGPETAAVLIADVGASVPTVAMDVRDGAAVVAWAQSAGDTTDVWAARVRGGAVLHRARVNAVRGAGSAHSQAPPTALVAPDGAVYVVWVEQRAVPGRRFPASDLRLARSDDGGRTFGPAVRVNPDPGFPTGHTFHSAAAGPDGALYVAWLDGTARDRERRASGKSPVQPVALHAAHAARHEAGTELVVTRSTDGGRTFEAPVVVARGTCECCRTALAVAPDGRLSLAWRHQFAGGARDIALAHSADGGQTFTAPERVRADDWQIEGCPHAGPALAAAPDGVPHVVWYTGAAGDRGVYRTGPSGTAAVALPDVSIRQVAATPDGAGGAWLAWESPAEGGTALHHQTADGALTPVTLLPGETPWLAAAAGRWAAVYAREGRVWLRSAP